MLPEILEELQYRLEQDLVLLEDLKDYSLLDQGHLEELQEHSVRDLEHLVDLLEHLVQDLELLEDLLEYLVPSGTFGGVPFGAGPGAFGSRPGALGGVGALGGPPRAFGGEIVAFGVAPAPGGSFGRSPALIGNNFGGSPFGPAPFAANQDPIGFGTPGGFGPERGAFGPGVVEVPQHYGARPIYGRAPAAPYQFGYGVEASDYNGGASFSLNQNFDGVLTTGRYNVNLPGGSYQSVSYSS